MSQVDLNDKRTSKWNVFPSTRTRACYISASQHIEMYEATLPELQEALSNLESNPELSIRIVPLLFHELRHWFDNIATVWGMKHLVSLFNAMNARKLNQEFEFWRIMEYRQLVNKDHLSEYYTTIGSRKVPDGYPNRWIYKPTCGRRYDHSGRPDPERPIVFTNYRWADNTHACRVPFSVASLLEAGAMTFEMEFEMATLLKLPAGERIIEENRIVKERLSEIYDVELGVYTTAVHLVANRMSLSALDEAFPLAGALASFCLNLPDHLFDKLTIPAEFAAWGELNKAAIRQRDRGYLFMVMCHSATKEMAGDVLGLIDDASQRSGLPPLYEIRKLAANAMREEKAAAIDGPFREHFEHVAEMGIRIHDELGVVLSLKGTLNSIRRLFLPPIVCYDGGIHALDETLHSAFEKWCKETIDLQDSMSEFVAACGY